MQRLIAAAVFMLFALPASAEPQSGKLPVYIMDEVETGALVRARVPDAATVHFGGRNLRLTEDGKFVIGFGRNATKPQELVITMKDGTVHRKTFQPQGREYPTQKIDGLPQKLVTPPKEVTDRIVKEAGEIKTVRKSNADSEDLFEQFVWPVKGRISGVFGSQRILNGVPKRPHNGLDIAAPTGTPIVAPVGGVVKMAADLYYTGYTVMLDHGYGVTSVYCHLDRMDVAYGETVAQGQPIGTVGMTGRATGPHLHWGLSWFNVALDPMLVLPKE